MASKFPNELNVTATLDDTDLLVVQKSGETQVRAITGLNALANVLTDAPSDSLVYARLNGTWVRAVAVSGDTMTGDLVFSGAGIDQSDYTQFNVGATPIPNAEGLLQWNDTDGTLDLGMSGGDVTMQIGQELFAKVRNDSGYETINNGQAVYISGRNGVFPTVRKALADSDATSRVLGVATQDILSPAFGFITTFGYVRGIKTDYTGAGDWGATWVTGDLLYVSKTVAGQLTNIEPDEPHHSDTVASVGVVSATQGSILVAIDRHQTLEELSDVDGTPPSQGSVLVWDGANNYWDSQHTISTNTATQTTLILKTLDDDATNNIVNYLDSADGLVRAVSVGGRSVVSKTTYTTTASTSTGYSHKCNSATPFTLTVTDGTQDGETIVIRNVGAGLVTLAGNIGITGATELFQAESVVLEWDTTDGEWQ